MIGNRKIFLGRVLKAAQFTCALVVVLALTRIVSIDQFHSLTNNQVYFCMPFDAEEVTCPNRDAYDFGLFMCIHMRNKIFGEIDEGPWSRALSSVMFRSSLFLFLLFTCVSWQMDRRRK